MTRASGGVGQAVQEPAGGRPRRRSGLADLYRAHERLVLGVASVLGVLVLWEIAARLGWINALFFSSPAAVAAAGINEVQQGDFWGHVRTTGFELLVGYVGAAVIGVPLGLAIGWYRTLSYVLDPWLTFFFALPRIALLPVIVLWLGIGIWSIVTVVFLGVFFTVAVNTVRGGRVVDQRLVRVSRIFGASEWKLFTTLVLPSAVPLIMVGLRLGVGRALAGVVIGELFAGAHTGLGRVITFASHSLQTDRVLFITILLIAVGVAWVELLRRVEQRFTTWRDDLGTEG